MDFSQLVEEITRQVCARLDGAESLSGGLQVLPPPSPPRQSVLVVWGRTEPATVGFDFEALVATLASVAKSSAVVFAVYPSAVFPCTSLADRLPAGAVRLLPGTPRWRDEAPHHQALLLPHTGVDLLAKLGLLIADEPAVEAALHMRLLNRPVLAGQDDVSTLLRSGLASRAVLDVLRRHQRDSQALGLELMDDQESLGRRLTSLLGSSEGGSISLGRTVVTQDDIVMLGQQGQKRVVYGAGSIVTALAWEAAQRLGIDVVLQ